MSNIIQITDFESGRYKIATNTFQTNDLQSFIDKYERHYLLRMFGVALYSLFIADLAGGVPQDPRFTAVFEPFEMQNACYFCDSQGMKEAIKALIYFHFERDRVTRSTPNGPKQSKGENSNNLDNVASDLVTRYNEGVDSFECIQYKMYDDADTYPEYEGIKVDKILFI